MKKAFACLMAALIVCTSAVPALAFSDISSGATAQSVEILQMMGVMQGFPDGSFRPGTVLTRAQFCKMAIVALGAQTDTAKYRDYTIFYDVRASHWASGFVNMAVREKKIITGMPDGSFKPESPVTFGQAVTILMRMLGYTDADASYNWPNGYIQLAAEKGLTDGITLGAYSNVTRADGAMLFKNLLLCHIKAESGTGALFISSIAGSVKEDVLILSTDAQTADGQPGGIQTDESDTSIYKVANTVSGEFEGQRGVLALDNAGCAWAFVPYALIRRDFTVGEVTYTEIKDQAGAVITVSDTTPVVKNGKKYKYGDAWYDIAVGMPVTAYFTKSGAVDHITCGMSAQSGSVAVIRGAIEPGTNPIPSLFAASSSPALFKNGLPAAVSDLRRYDVLAYDEHSNMVSVTDRKLTGIYEDAYPNTATPVKLTMMGNTFEVLSDAAQELEKFKLGERITLLLTADGKVAGVQSSAAVSAQALGIVESAASGQAEVQLLSGLTVKGKISDKSIPFTGQLVSVSGSQSGYINLMRVSGSKPGRSVNLTAMTAGQVKVAPNVAVLEQVTGSGPVTKISLSDIKLLTIPSDKVLYFEYDYAGRISLMLLDDVTGDRYTYGLLHYMPGETDSSDGMTATNSTLTISNSKSDTAASVECGRISVSEGAPGGLAPNNQGRLGRYVELIKLATVSRTDFSGEDSVKAGGKVVEIAEDVQVYIDSTDRYDTLARARGFAKSFEIYIDRTPEQGGKVRMIIAK